MSSYQRPFKLFYLAIMMTLNSSINTTQINNYRTKNLFSHLKNMLMIFMGTEREGGGGYAYCSLKLKFLHKIFGEIAQYDLFQLL